MIRTLVRRVLADEIEAGKAGVKEGGDPREVPHPEWVDPGEFNPEVPPRMEPWRHRRNPFMAMV